MLDRFDLLVGLCVLLIAYIFWMDVRPLLRGGKKTGEEKARPSAKPDLHYREALALMVAAKGGNEHTGSRALADAAALGEAQTWARNSRATSSPLEALDCAEWTRNYVTFMGDSALLFDHRTQRSTWFDVRFSREQVESLIANDHAHIGSSINPIEPSEPQ